MFTPEQPDLNWEDPGTLAAFEEILRFWLDRGVDGFRIDVAHGLMKKQGLPDVGPVPIPDDLPYQDRPEVLDIPLDRIQDPTWERSGHTDRGRDGCRVPLPWSGDAAPFGFSGPEATASPWLPQPAAWKQVTAAVQSQDPESMLSLYREALALRRETIARLPTDVSWIDAGPDVLAFSRSEAFRCVVNFSDTPIDLPATHRVLVSSDAVTGGKLPPNAAAWLGSRS
jgi:alpha-glucosidase